MAETLIRILLLEDNPGDIILLRDMLLGTEFPRFDLVQSETLDQARSFLQNDSFNVILLDLTLSDSRGIETFLAVQGMGTHVPIIVITAHDDRKLAAQALQKGAQDYLVKGHFDSQLLDRSIHYAIERKNAETKLLTYQRQLRSLAARLAMSEEREKRRVAGDLDLHIGQILALAKIKLGSLQGNVSDTCQGELTELRTLIEQSIQYIRSLTFELSSPILYELGLKTAIEAIVEKIQGQYHLHIDIQEDEAPKPLDDDTRILLFQSIQELLMNVVQHARAGNVQVSIRRVENEICIQVEDDGMGFDVTKIHSSLDNETEGFGLLVMRERLRYAGGAFELDSTSGEGTRAKLKAPLRE